MSKPTLLPFSYLLIIAISSMAFWALNLMLFRFGEGGFVGLTLGALGISGLFWSVWLGLFIKSDWPEKYSMKQFFPRFYWVGFLTAAFSFIVMESIVITMFELNEESLLISLSALLMLIGFFIWFWSWSYQQFYHNAEAKKHQ